MSETDSRIWLFRPDVFISFILIQLEWKMLNLSQKLSKSAPVDDKNVIVTNNNNNVSDKSRYIGGSRVSIRDQLLIKGVLLLYYYFLN